MRSSRPLKPLRSSASDHILLEQRPSGLYPLIAEALQVDRTIRAEEDELGDRVSGGRRLLESMPGKAVREEHGWNFRMAADHRILVESVVVVVPDPCIDDFHGLERRHPGREPRPDTLLEPVVVDLPVEGLRFLVLFWREPAD